MTFFNFKFFDTKFFVGISFMFFFISAVFFAYEERIQSEIEKEKEKGNMKKSHIMAWTGFSFFILGLCIEAYKIMFKRKPKVADTNAKTNAKTDAKTDAGANAGANAVTDAVTYAVTDEGEGEGEGEGESVDEGV